MENRCMLISLAVFLSIACLGQIISIFVFWNVKTLIEEDTDPGQAKLKKQMIEYGKDAKVTEMWDFLQKRLQCCGVRSFRSWEITHFSGSTNTCDKDKVPSSCCVNSEDKCCGAGVFTAKDPHKKVYTDGCATILIGWMVDDVVPLIQVYAVLGVITAIIEIIGITLASAYVAQISRHHKRARLNNMEMAFSTHLSRDKIFMPDIPDYETTSPGNESEV
jgi:hypothetical protein